MITEDAHRNRKLQRHSENFNFPSDVSCKCCNTLADDPIQITCPLSEIALHANVGLVPKLHSWCTGLATIRSFLNPAINIRWTRRFNYLARQELQRSLNVRA